MFHVFQGLGVRMLDSQGTHRETMDWRNPTETVLIPHSFNPEEQHV